jgi:hypothetical protein
MIESKKVTETEKEIVRAAYSVAEIFGTSPLTSATKQLEMYDLKMRPEIEQWIFNELIEGRLGVAE